MELRYTEEEQAFRAEVRAFYEASLPASIKRKQMLGKRLQKEDIVTWQRILNKKGWAVPLWPREWGGTGWDAVRYYIFREEMYRAYAPEPLGPNLNLIGPVIIAFGKEEQKQRFLPAIRNLDLWFAQGFSEPGSGSDLASLKTRAERQGDHYVVNGQKLWTSNCHRADWVFALVRTDPNAQKHRGISYLLIDLKTPGITIKPVITLDGDHHTNEVFFDNVKVPVANLIGEENKGWNYTKFLLGHERVAIARVGLSKTRVSRIKSLASQVVVEGQPMSENRRFREKLALIETELKALEMTNMMVVANMKKATGHGQDPRTSVLKLKGSELQQSLHELMLELAGPHATARQLEWLEIEQIRNPSDESLIGPEWAGTAGANYFFGRAVSIFGGSNEIQHNVVAKGVLGL